MSEDCRKKRVKTDCGATSVGDGVVRFTYGVGEGAACGEDLGSISMDQCENETINIPCPTNSALEIKHCDDTYIYDPSDVEDTVIDLGCGRLIDWSRMPVCDDCIVWCGDEGPMLMDPNNKPTFAELAKASGKLRLKRAAAQGFEKQKEAIEDFKESQGHLPSTVVKEETFTAFATADNPRPGAAVLPPDTEKEPPCILGNVPADGPLKTYVVKFWSTSCGICGKMAHYDSKVTEELGAEFISCQKLKPAIWARYRYLALQRFENPEKTMGFPTYFVAQGPNPDRLRTLGVVNGGMDKGTFRKKVQECLDRAVEGHEWDPPFDTTSDRQRVGDPYPYLDPRCEPKVRDIRVSEGQICPKGYGEIVTFELDTTCCEPNNGMFSIKIGGKGDYEKLKGHPGVSFPDAGDGPNNHGDGKERKKLRIDCDKFTYDIKDGSWKIKWEGDCDQKDESFDVDHTWEARTDCPGKDPICNKEIDLQITCPNVTGEPGSKYKVTAQANGVANSNVTFTYCKNTCEPGNQLHSGKGATSYEGTYPNPGDDYTLIVTASFTEDGCDITKNAQCQIAGVAATPDCKDKLTPSIDCGGKCKPGSKVTITGHATGDNNSKIYFKWFKGNKSDGQVVGEGLNKTSVQVDCPQCGQKQQYALWVSQPGGECNGDTGVNCDVVAEDCDPCQGVSCPPCHNCVNGECVDQCGPNQECVGGKCQDKDPCQGVTCPPCHRCINGECVNQCGPDQECQGGSCVGKDPCENVTCPPCHTCVGGECVNQCQPGQVCSGGRCVWPDPCEGVTCPPCHQCVNGECVNQCGPDQECQNGSCVGKDPCEGVTCPPCHTCIGGECVNQCAPGEKCEDGVCVPGDPCEDVVCGPCQECINGECESTCGPDEVCEDGVCVPGDPCKDVICGPCEQCINGECEGTCGPDQECVDGVCQDKDPCQDVVCGPCEQCVNGECEGTCGPDQECVDGVCQDIDPCKDVVCGPCQYCTNGECVDICPPDYECRDGICVRPDPPIEPEEEFECDEECTGWTINWNCVRNKVFNNFGVIKGGDRVTIWPSHGDLRLHDVEISTTGNTGPGVDVVYDPIFLDFEQNQGVNQTDLKSYDYMGSEGLKDESNVFPYMMKDVWLSPVLTIPDLPSGANGYFIELYWVSSLNSGAKCQQDHPSYQLDCPVEFYTSLKNVMTISGATFVSGKEKDMHSDSSLSFTGKLSPTTVMDKVYRAHARQTKLNFAWLDRPGVSSTHQTSIFVKTYHYAYVGAGLGRAKVIPIKASNKTLAEKWIKEQIDNYYVEGDVDEVTGNYRMNNKDIVRLQGNDLRQAVDQLNSAIDFKLAQGTGDQNAIRNLRTGLMVEVLEGDGTFEEIRNALTALKARAFDLGVIGLTKLERNAGVQWGEPGNPA